MMDTVVFLPFLIVGDVERVGFRVFRGLWLWSIRNQTHFGHGLTPPELRPPEYSICSSCARNHFSGAIDGRPTLAYIASNCPDNWVSASSTMARMARSGWSFRTRSSGDK